MVEKKKPEKHSTLQNSFVASPKNLLILLASKKTKTFLLKILSALRHFNNHQKIHKKTRVCF